MRDQARYSAATIALLLFWASTCSSETHLEAQYRRLERLSWKILQHGTTNRDSKDMRRVRDFFASQGDPAGEFLVRKLQDMNQEEAKFLQGADDARKGLEYAARLIAQRRNPAIKYYLCHILADMFANMSPALQTTTLKTFVVSYTPSTYGDAQQLNYPFLRTGRKSIPYFLKLAEHENTNVRCRVCSDLNALGREITKSKPANSSSVMPPSIECRADPAERERAIKEWREWWENEGQNLPFPTIPSFFDTQDEQTSSSRSQKKP